MAPRRSRSDRQPLCSARSTSIVVIVVAILFAAGPAFAAQTWRDKRVYFGDAHWHSCLSQDGEDATLTAQYESMLNDYELDFSLQSDHAEGASAGIIACDTYLPARTPPLRYSGEAIADAMKAAADDWNGRELLRPNRSPITFVTFPGYEWAPDARCWQLRPLNIIGDDSNANDNTPGHINYFFSDTTGWSYSDDVWAPGAGDSTLCSIASVSPYAYYDGSKDWVDEILGQLIHQRDDPDRSYDLLIQYNHPAAAYDKDSASDHLAKWFDFEHGGSCSVADGGAPCTQNQCEATRRAYGLTSVEWYTNHEAGIGSTEFHGTLGQTCTGDQVIDAVSDRCVHDLFHVPDRWVSSRGLREGYHLASFGGSDSHSGRRNAPSAINRRGAGSASLTAVYASDATRPAIWDGLSRRRTYALSRLRETGPVHKGRVDLFTPDPVGGETSNATTPGPRIVAPIPEFGMGEIVATVAAGSTRSFTIAAAAEEPPIGGEPADSHVYPVELRLYRVGPNTPLTTRTDVPFYWLDDLPGDPGKFGELIGTFPNTTGATTLAHTFTGVVVRPGDAVFAVVPYSDYVWVDDYYDTSGGRLDADGNGEPDDGKSGFPHGDNNTWARTTPIFFHVSNEVPARTTSCSTVTFNGSGAADGIAAGGSDGGIAGDDDVLPVATPGGYDLEWNRWRFTLAADYEYLDLSFFTKKDEDDTGHLFAVRIDGQLVYSGRAGIDHAADALVTMGDIPFRLKKGLHQIEVHVDDQEYATGDNDPNFHCNDYDGPPAFLDAVLFHGTPGAPCDDGTGPVITCPAPLLREDVAPGGLPASDPDIAAFLAGATAIDAVDPAPVITHDAPALFPTGTTTVTFTAEDASGNSASCTSTVTVTEAPPLNHFLCYDVNAPNVRRTVGLSDVFGARTASVRKLERVCTPADKNGEDPTAPSDADHLASYKIAADPSFEGVRDLTVTNQFGPLVVELRGPHRLLVPTGKDLNAPPAAYDPAINGFQCYRVRHAQFRASGLAVTDQFGSQIVDVKRPTSVCVPVDRDGTGVVQPTTGLLCYEARTRGRTTRPVFIGNAFETGPTSLLRPRELCVPSEVSR